MDLLPFNVHNVSLIGYFGNNKHYYCGGAIKKISYIESNDDLTIESKYLEIEKRKEESKTKPK